MHSTLPLFVLHPLPRAPFSHFSMEQNLTCASVSTSKQHHYLFKKNITSDMKYFISTHSIFPSPLYFHIIITVNMCLVLTAVHVLSFSLQNNPLGRCYVQFIDEVTETLST